MRRQDLKGLQFEKLLVLDYSHRNGKHLYWHCKCDCGNDSVQCTTNLKRGKVVSCGCVRNRKSTERIKLLIPQIKFEKGVASFNVLYSNYHRGALKRNIEFHLTKEEFKVLTSQNCHYCNVEPKNGNK